MIDVSNCNATFRRYPVTVEDKGWVYGVWYCGTSWDRVRLHGQYPPTFLKRALSLFPHAKDVLHCPSGTVTHGVTVDLIRDEVRQPQIQADASSLPFPDSSFDLYLSDPPYTAKDSEKYGCKPFPLGRMVTEAHRVLRPGGHLGILHTYYPSYRRQMWNLRGLIAVVTGFQRATRIFSIFESKKLVDSKDHPIMRRARQTVAGKEMIYRFRRYNSKGNLMAEGVRVHAKSLEEAEVKAKSLYSPWDIRERLEFVEMWDESAKDPQGIE